MTVLHEPSEADQWAEMEQALLDMEAAKKKWAMKEKALFDTVHATLLIACRGVTSESVYPWPGTRAIAKVIISNLRGKGYLNE